MGAFSLIKLKRNILWLGPREEQPPKALGDILSKVQFVPFDTKPVFNQKKQYSAIVISVPSSDVITDELFESLAALPDRPKKFLLVQSCSVDEKLRKLLNEVHFNRIFVSPDDSDKLGPVLEQALEEDSKQRTAVERRKKVRNASQALESKTSDLESLVEERTAHIQLTKREIEVKVSRVRALIRFLKELALVVSVEDLLHLLRTEAKVFHEVKEPLLAYRGQAQSFQMLYFQGSSVLKKENVDPWPDLKRIRLNDKGDSQYLADIYGRPFAQVLSIPVNIRASSESKGQVIPAVLYFEHSLSEENRIKFIEFIEERLQPVSLAMDRVFLERDLTEASLLWERTFDGISDPVAIFDSDAQLIRSNRAFQNNLQSLSSEELFHERIQHNSRVYDVQTYPISGGQDALPTNVVIHYVDVTVSHQLQKQMIQQEKMAALGHMAGNIAHELNNPLTGIRSLSQVILQTLPDNSEVKSDLTEVEKAAERCQSIITNLLEFSRGSVEKKLMNTPVNEIVEKTLPLLKTVVSRYETQIDLLNDEAQVAVEPQLMQQVVFNLIKNAGQAMGESGKLQIKTEFDELDGRQMVVIRVKDSGVGIPESEQDSVFDFFYTTKEEGQGTGLGLSMSRSIVKGFGGDILLDTEEGIGSEFSVYLPKVKADS